jgi:beta-lactam-binding protein with PASTA domain
MMKAHSRHRFPARVLAVAGATLVTMLGAAGGVSGSAAATATDVATPASHCQIQVPDVVGWDHQAAQDRMQAAGLYNLDEEDATGQGRLILWDRNWTVVWQSPAAGTLVSPETLIVLYSRKDDE